ARPANGVQGGKGCRSGDLRRCRTRPQLRGDAAAPRRACTEDREPKRPPFPPPRRASRLARLSPVVVLGIESSCDDSAAAVLDAGVLRSSVVSSQDAVHGPYGGVVPELASRHHIRNMLPVIDAALARAERGLEAVDGIAVTCGPGLFGSRLAEQGARRAIRPPRARIRRARFDFSFSGFKAAVWQRVHDEPPSPAALPHLAAGVQEALVDMLVDTTVEAIVETGVPGLVVCGGVSANRRLRTRMAEAGAELGVYVVFPRFQLCTDNAAMIAMAGWRRLEAGEDDGLAIGAAADLPFGAPD